MEDKFEIIKMVLEHIIRLHKAGIVADIHKIIEEEREFRDSLEGGDVEKATLEAADWKIARLSYEISNLFGWYQNYTAAIAKNQRRLDWMEAHPDPTKTPVELWKMAKVALGEVEA